MLCDLMLKRQTSSRVTKTIFARPGLEDNNSESRLGYLSHDDNEDNVDSKYDEGDFRAACDHEDRFSPSSPSEYISSAFPSSVDGLWRTKDSRGDVVDSRTVGDDDR